MAGSLASSPGGLSSGDTPSGRRRAAEAEVKAWMITEKICPSLAHSTEGGMVVAATMSASAEVP